MPISRRTAAPVSALPRERYATDPALGRTRDDLLAKVDKAKFSAALNAVSAKIDTTTLAQLYYDVAINHKDIAEVAKAWLKANGFVS